ncbi:MAG: hypothetical protein NTY72_13380 [Bacteroidetes bacterium]|nr:hypothetical protein [Bacteroidota bacterium]
MYFRNAFSKIIIALIFLLIGQSSFAQPTSFESQQYYEVSKGISYVPVLTKPALIYHGKLYTGKKQLDYLVDQLKDPTSTILYSQYRENRTWATILTVLGSATSIVGLLGTNNEYKINWYLLGGGLLLNGTAGALNNIAAQQLRAIAVQSNKMNNSVG